MLQVEWVNQSKVSQPRSYIEKKIDQICRELRRRRVIDFRGRPQLTLVFLDTKPAQKLNLQFRKKNYATDVLSFAGDGSMELGELVLCPQVLKKQAKEHKLSYRDELTYMVLHGILHLLGFDHERDQKQAKEMFDLQDSIFDKLLL